MSRSGLPPNLSVLTDALRQLEFERDQLFDNTPTHTNFDGRLRAESQADDFDKSGFSQVVASHQSVLELLVPDSDFHLRANQQHRRD